MKELNFEKALEKYNDLMFITGFDHCTIKTGFAEQTEDWNLRDMVAEVDYVLSNFNEAGNSCHDLKEIDFKEWRSITGKLQRFINRYEKYIDGLKCHAAHCSRYDNI